MSTYVNQVGPNEHATIYFGSGNTSKMTINGKDMSNRLSAKANRLTKFQIFADGELWETVDANTGIDIHIHTESVDSVQTASGNVILYDAIKVDRINTMSGDVRCQKELECAGSISTMSGSVKAAGSIRANKISSMSGDIRGTSK